MTLKVAVIGVGNMGRNHARVYWEMPQVKLVGIADSNKSTVDAVADRYNTKHIQITGSCWKNKNRMP